MESDFGQTYPFDGAKMIELANTNDKLPEGTELFR